MYRTITKLLLCRTLYHTNLNPMFPYAFHLSLHTSSFSFVSCSSSSPSSWKNSQVSRLIHSCLFPASSCSLRAYAWNVCACETIFTCVYPPNTLTTATLLRTPPMLLINTIIPETHADRRNHSKFFSPLHHDRVLFSEKDEERLRKEERKRQTIANRELFPLAKSMKVDVLMRSLYQWWYCTKVHAAFH